MCAIALTGCAAAPIPTPPRSPSSAPSDGPHAAPRATPEPQTVDPLAAVTSIVVRPENLDLNDADGTTIQELSYDADAAEFVAALSGVLHATPAVAEKPGGIEWSPSTEYVWPGVTLRDDHERGDYQQDMNLEVEFSLPMVGLGVSVATIQGFQPGADLEWLARWMDEPFSAENFNVVQAEHGPEIGPRTHDTYANANSVAVRDFTGSTVIYAPWNFGIGHV
ncbi:hypothetical protein [Glaciibacter psychrotolerans]|uniref:Uncharacterized protein n=1 Tax=Glaciibacter psychrotolerans TaxID=670054 RepID=A0A7Z0J6U5_9MICO|nr:hypothetical protein [Leifsonia psychrotolerans]NYJ20284.1 hypothetical protein [Leifsonia psychrotolerans]